MDCWCSDHFQNTFQVMLKLAVNIYFSLKVNNSNHIDISIYILIYEKKQWKRNLENLEIGYYEMLYMEISESRKKIPFELKIIRCNLKVVKYRKRTKS